MQFRIQTIFIAILVFVAGCAGTEPTGQQDSSVTTDTQTLLKFQEEISVDFLKSHLSVFAHDTMKGRETGTPSEKVAAEYLADQYKKMGLQPAGDENSYFQKFDLNVSKSDSVVFTLHQKAGKDKKLVSRSVADQNRVADFVRLFGGTDSLKGDIVFAGFGVNDQANNVTHLEGADVKGKWVLVFREIPTVVDGDTLLNPAINEKTRFQMIMQKGAAGVLTVPANSRQFNAAAQKIQQNFGKTGRMSLAYRDTADGAAGGFNRGYNLVHPDLVSEILGLKSENELTDYRRQLVNRLTSFEPKLLNYSLSYRPYSSTEKVQSQNVLAFLEGADPQLKDEVVVLTSHYDHVGIGEPDSTGDRIYNGADDDGSGTIGVLNIAKAFAQAGNNGVKPKRSVLFLNVSGEEKGLLGSRYYSDHPVFPMKSTVANLNTDMIGRIDEKHEEKGIEEYAYIIGADLISSELDSLLKAANKKSGQIAFDKKYNDLNDPNQFHRRSDHWHFGRKQVPFAFFFTGVHEDYHRPSDEVHKIRFEKMESILRTMYAATVMIANAEEAPRVDNQQFIEITKEKN